MALFFLIVLVQRGGLIDSFRRIDGRGVRFVIAVGVMALVAAVIYRAGFYMNAERESWITEGRTRGDSISLGFDTKSRFRSMSQPLGRVLDREGKVLAGYELRNGHLQRYYPAGPTAAHLVGYWTGPLRDGVGIEKAMTLVNDSLKDDKPHDLRLTLDLRLQDDAMRALGGELGAIVVMDPATGQVLAAANFPTYDPNRITNDTVWKKLVLDNRLRPLISRVVRDNFSPGSSIKPFIAAAANATGAVLPEERGFSCAGEFAPGGRIKPISDHGSQHGAVDVFSAMRVSCNVYFSMLAYQSVGYEPTKEYLESIGFNKRLAWNTGAFLNESSTLLPAMSWVRARDEIAKTRLGIGQASVKTNPLHMATIVSGIANGGVFMRPTLELRRAVDTLPWRMDPSAGAWLDKLMREPLLPGGTAYRAFAGIEKRGLTVYGKTGTADPEPDGREPSWFISYAEKNGRRYTVIVAIQNRRHRYAGDVNAPMARRMFEALDTYGYFSPLERARRPVRRGARPDPDRGSRARPSDEPPTVVDTIRLEEEPTPTSEQPETSPTPPATTPPATPPDQSPATPSTPENDVPADGAPSEQTPADRRR
ncbi:MAG TPA: penicillin-binding transpeptidase domain-containing protein [Candidatus Kapabacteria bacterium]|jgi:cell division protein FtsI/penicillin-binding protein 2|nr:penicillin-binding transpeptidase domain-containing protein [Candidatus Kapabacteria bacterium]